MNAPGMHLEKPQRVPQACEVCRSPFTPKRATWAKFCSTKCRNAFNRTLTPEALHRRVVELEAKAHPPFDFTELVNRLESAEKKLARLEAIASGEVMP